MKRMIFFALYTLWAGYIFSQQGVSINIDNSAPDASAILDIKSTVKGMLIPRMSSAQRNLIGTPAPGLLVYDLSSESFWFHNGTSWEELISGYTSEIRDADGDTKVQVEESVDEDIIRFDINGEEKMVLQNNANYGTILEIKDGNQNTFVGDSTGFWTDVGWANAGFGYKVLHYNSSGWYNTAMGYGTLHVNTVGGNNSALGGQALGFNTTGNNNTAIGSFSLFQNYTGSSNTSVGVGALYSNVANSRSTAIGQGAMQYAHDGVDGIVTQNTAIGYEALRGSATAAMNTGTLNTAIGDRALFSITSGSSNTAVGVLALALNTIGYQNTAVGNQALYFNNLGTNNTAIGLFSLNNNTRGSNNIGIGNESLYTNRSNGRSTAVGIKAMKNANDNDAILMNTYNTAIGYEALLGSIAPANNTGRFNTALGDQALVSNSSGNNNTAVGKSSLSSNTSGNFNSASGDSSLYLNTTGYDNTVVGHHAMYLNSTGFGNCALGAITGISSANNKYSTFLGYGADYTITGFPEVYYSTAIGYNARVTSDYQVRIGNSSTTSIGGEVGWTTLSDGRFKDNILEDVPGLALVMRLRPVTYHVDALKLGRYLNESSTVSDERSLNKKETRHTGFIAQEVSSVVKELGYEFSGVDAPKNEAGLYGLRYAEFVVPLVKAVQEQQIQIDELKREIEELKKLR